MFLRFCINVFNAMFNIMNKEKFSTGVFGDQQVSSVSRILSRPYGGIS